MKRLLLAMIGLFLATAACSKSDSEENKNIITQKSTINDIITSIDDIFTGVYGYLDGARSELTPNQQMIVDALRPCENASTEEQSIVTGPNCPIDFTGDHVSFSEGEDGSSKLNAATTMTVKNSDFETLVKLSYLNFKNSGVYSQTETQEFSTVTLDGQIKSVKWGNDTKYSIVDKYVGTYKGNENSVAFNSEVTLSIQSEKLSILALIIMTGTTSTNDNNYDVTIDTMSCSINGVSINCLDVIGDPRSKIVIHKNNIRKLK